VDQQAQLVVDLLSDWQPVVMVDVGSFSYSLEMNKLEVNIR